MYLSKIRISNYRAIRNATLSCEDGITVFVGENGCGKSSVLNALEACLGRKLRGDKFDIKPSDFFNDFDTNEQASELEIQLYFSHIHNENDKSAKAKAEREALRVYSGPLKKPELLDSDSNLYFSLLLKCKRSDTEGVIVDYAFLNYDNQPVLSHEKRTLLLELRRLIPVMRIRSSVLKPPNMDAVKIDAATDEKDRSRLQVEQILKQAYGDLLREEDYTAEQSLRAEGEKMNAFFSQLDEMLKCSNTHSVGRVAAPLSPSNSGMHYVSLLRGSGARSLAMLYFAGAFFDARGTEIIGPDSRPIISVEYPETNLHPLMLTSLWNLINSLPTQLLVTTYCVELLSAIPFRSLRRLVRTNQGDMSVYQVQPSSVDLDDMRRIAYHLRVRRGAALFMRVWLLVEGETEYWLLPEIARAMGFDLWQEGVEFIEFAQCGLEPLARLANHLGISWFLLCDGDKAGQTYASKAERIARVSNGLGHVVCLSSVDIEHSFWDSGYADVFIEAAGVDKEFVAPSSQTQQGVHNKKKNQAKLRAKALEKSRDVIKKAVKRLSKPGLALKIAEAVTETGLGVPSDIEHLIYNVVRTARESGGGDGQFYATKKTVVPEVAPDEANRSPVTYEVMDEFSISDTPIDNWRLHVESADEGETPEGECSDADGYEDDGYDRSGDCYVENDDSCGEGEYSFDEGDDGYGEGDDGVGDDSYGEGDDGYGEGDDGVGDDGYGESDDGYGEGVADSGNVGGDTCGKRRGTKPKRTKRNKRR